MGELREDGVGGFGGFLDLDCGCFGAVGDGIDSRIKEWDVGDAAASGEGVLCIWAVAAVDMLRCGEVGCGTSHFGGEVDAVGAFAELGADFLAVTLQE